VRFPARIGGGYRSGKTTRLRALARELLDPLVICATEAAAAEFGMGATTFWGVAAGIVARHHRPVRVLSSAEQRERLGGVWVQEIAQYQASFLGREELRTHAQAAGVYDHWERIADAADDYLARLDAAGEADWAGVLVRASLLLRHEDVLAAERARFSHVLVDDFEAASFATNRLLAQLVGFGGPVAVAGNQAADLWRHLGGSPRYLDRFPSRFGAVQEVVLDAQYQSEGEGSVTLMLVAGGDPWLALPSGQPLPAPLATSLFWDSATLIHVPMNDWPPDPPVDVLAGPDVPSDEERRHRRQREDDVRRKFAASRARRVEVGQWSR
jgi:hypothetical protein